MKNKIFLSQLASFSLMIASTTILYFAQMDLLYRYYDPDTVYRATISYAYFAQGAGLLFSMLLCRYRPDICRSRFLRSGAMLMLLPLLAATYLLHSGAALLLLLVLTNLLIGCIFGSCFTGLAVFIDEKQIGRCWGSAFALGNLLSWAVSQLDADFLTAWKIIPLLCAMIVLAVIPILNMGDLPSGKEGSESADENGRQRFHWLLPVILLMSVIYTIGSTDYSMIAETLMTSSTFYTRCIYAAGLLLAGILYDRSHNNSAVLALASMIYPFMASILMRIHFQVRLIYCLSYFFLGFFAVYRACAFISIGSKDKKLLPLSGCGLMISRFVEGLFALVNAFIVRDDTSGFFFSGILFVPLIVVFCRMISQQSTTPKPSEEELRTRFSEEHQLTRREEEILALLLQGATNGEIAAALTISEGTARFHVSNVLKKTNCKTRNEVVHKYRQQ